MAKPIRQIVYIPADKSHLIEGTKQLARVQSAARMEAITLSNKVVEYWEKGYHEETDKK